MVKTNKEFRSNLAKEMGDKRKERNKLLQQVDRLPISEELKEENRRAIMENFEKEMDGMKKRPGYEETKKTHVAERKAKHSLDTARERRNRLWQEKERLEMELRNADNDVIDRGHEYNKSQINHGGEIENNGCVPQGIEENRRERREGMYLYGIKQLSHHNAKKVKMMESMDKLPVKREKEEVRENGIGYCENAEFRLGNKKYKILLPESILYQNGGVTFSDISEIKDERVKKYLKEKEGEGFHMPQKEQIESILQELGKILNSDDETDEIAMLSYLLGMCGSLSTYLLDGDFDICCDFYPGYRGIYPRRNTISNPKKIILIKEE